MTVAATTNRVSFAGNGVTTAFAFPYPYRASSDFEVTLRTNSTGVETTQTITTHYTISGVANTGTGGFDSMTLTMVTAPPSGTTLVINRKVPFTSGFDPTAGSDPGAANLEGAIDRAMLAMQQLQEQLNRALLLPKTSSLSGLALPEPSSTNVSKVLGINAAGTGYELITAASAFARGTVYETTVSAAPSSEGTHTTIDNSYTGDLSKQYFPVKHTITGAATAGQPTSGYDSVPEIFPFYVWVDNDSGHNQSTSSNDGRTGIAAHRVRLQQDGQGDLYALWVTGNVGSTKSGSTSFLANPAAVVVGANLGASVAGAYLNPGEFLLQDNGNDVAAIGWVVNLDRDVATGAKNAWWAGYRVQSVGAEEVDVAFSAIGPMRIGLDLSFCTFDANKAAVTLKADDRIYFNVTATDASSLSRYPSSFSTTYLTYASGLSGMNLVVNNNSCFQAYANQVLCPSNTRFRALGGLGGAIRSVSANTTLTVNDFVVNVDATGASRTITLPTAASSTNVIYCVRKTDASGNTVTIDGDGSETIDGATTVVISTQWDRRCIISDGTSWSVIAD